MEEELIEEEPRPERALRWASIALAGLGAAAIAVVALLSLGVVASPGLRALAFAPGTRAIVGSLMGLTALTGGGLLVAGIVAHRLVDRHVFQEFTREGLVEEISQELDRVNSRLDLLSESLAATEARLARVGSDRRRAEPEVSLAGGPEPVPVNVLAAPPRAPDVPRRA